MIIKVKQGYRVVGEKKRRNIGTYKTKKETLVRLRQVEMFKHMRKK